MPLQKSKVLKTKNNITEWFSVKPESFAKYQWGRVIYKNSKEHYEGDHIIPWAKGGKTNYDNLQVLCKDCHYKKSTL